jgi:polyisoprenoid-binding protein YceI
MTSVRVTRRWLLAIPLALLATMAAGAAMWHAAPLQSELGFTAEQAGAKFKGRFEKYSADVRLDPKDLASSRIEVTVEVASVDTKDADRDSTLRAAEFFWVDRYPRAVYVAEKITQVSPGVFQATGKLTLRSVTREVPITFRFKEDGKGASLIGTADLKRLDFGVGKGEWQSTEWLANEVQVQFSLRLQK